MHRMHTRFPLFLDPNPPPGGAATEPRSSAELATQLDRMVTQLGNERAAALQLMRDNFKIRERYRAAKEQVAAYQNRAPKEGEVTLSKEDAELWKQFRALNLKPDELKSKIEAGDKAVGELATVRANEVWREASESTGWKQSVLRSLGKAHEFTVEMRKQNVKDGDKVVETMVPFIKRASVQNDPGEPLEAFVERELADYLPALQAEDTGARPAQGATRPGVELPEQRPSTRKVKEKSSEATTAAQRHLASRYGAGDKKEITT